MEPSIFRDVKLSKPRLSSLSFKKIQHFFFVFRLIKIYMSFQMRSDMTFLHVRQSSLFFNMFVLLLDESKVLLDNVQKLHIQFLKFLPPPFFMALED
jgi:hypothetical protein